MNNPPHLHLHLEPGIRKARQVGRPMPLFRGREEFLRAHDPGARDPGPANGDRADRMPVSLADLTGFLLDLHAEQRRQAVPYAEVRLAPRRFVASGNSLTDVLRAANDAVMTLDSPRIRLVLLLNRNDSEPFIEMCRTELSAGLPDAFVAVDLAGDETRFADVERFRRFFGDARDAGLGVTIHAGEFGPEDGIWKALDRLGADRIGHGVAAGGSRALARRLAADKITIESAPGANVALQAVPSLSAHPLPWLIGQGVPVCLNADVPLHIGSDLPGEWRLASELLADGADALLAMRTAAQNSVFRRKQDRLSMQNIKDYRGKGDDFAG